MTCYNVILTGRARVGITNIVLFNPEKCRIYGIFRDFEFLVATNWLHITHFLWSLANSKGFINVKAYEENARRLNEFIVEISRVVLVPERRDDKWLLQEYGL